MTDKEILIDGVNVKKCKRLIGSTSQYCRYKKCDCNEYPNCMFKQRARLQQENTELKQKKEELEKKLEALQIQDDENIVYEVSEYEFNRANKYEQALKEIREIAENIVKNDVYENSDTKAQKIIDKINEVLDDKINAKNPCVSCDVEPPAMKFKCPECEYGDNYEE